MRRITFPVAILAMFLIALLSTSARAQFLDSAELNKRGSETLSTGLLQITVKQDSGAPTQFFVPRDRKDAESDRTDKFWRLINLTRGVQYGISVTKISDIRRLMVCIAVDGRNVHGGGKVEGDFAQYETWRKSGGSCWVTGGTLNADRWTAKDNPAVGARLKVTDFSDSVAARFGDDGAQSTIVLSIFLEDEPLALNQDRGATRGAKGAEGGRGLGTTLGERTEQKVATTTFNAQDVAVEVVALKYQTKRSIEAAGYIFTTGNRAW